CALRPNNQAVCWPTGVGYLRETTLPGPFKQVAAGGDVGCGLRVDGTIECWTGNTELVYGPPIGPRPPPPTGAYSALWVGLSHSCALGAAGPIVCWGYSRIGGAPPLRGTFVEISFTDGGNGVQEEFAHGCALKRDGTLTCWGNEGLDSISSDA